MQHPTQACTVDKNAPAKCINCKGQHPASYRGCEVAKELQKLRDQTRKQPQQKRNRDNNIQTETRQLRRRKTQSQKQKSKITKL